MPTAAPSDTYLQLGHLVADFVDKAGQIYRGQAPGALSEPVVISGAALGLPGTERIFDDANVGRILNGEQCIDVIPTRFRRAMLDKHITRLVKSEQGGPTFEVIDSAADVIKLAGRGGAFDLGSEFGVSAERLPALDITTRLAIGAGLDALRDAGIPLVMRYKTTSKGTYLPDRWVLPDALRDDTGVIFASAFPGYDELVGDLTRYYTDHTRREQLAMLESLRGRLVQSSNGHDAAVTEIDHRIHDLRAAIEQNPYAFDRRFLFRILSMGHSQFAELIGARGPNTQINSACASSTQAVALAEDWIHAGRCRRVIIVAGDDVTSDRMLEWIGAGFLASGAAATDDVVEEAAIPFDRRRHGMLLGMGAAAMIVESAEAVRERGIRPICEVLSTLTANSAFHGTRLDVDHICHMMESVITQAERRWGIQRQQIAPQTVFVSHETYTPARGGSAAAEVHALRAVFGPAADQIVVANTKGFTGHAMGVGIEDVVAIKSLETGLVPPVANFKEVDPDLGPLNLSKGGAYPVQYALRLAAGFGSQISMTLMRWVPTPDGTRPDPDALGFSYRVADAGVWKACLNRISGYSSAELEVVSRTLRVKDQGPAERVAQPVAAPRPAEVRLPASVHVPAPQPTVAAERALSDRVDGRTDAVKARVLALVAETTGYPPDMLDLDLDLEADLGIDTVKQAEVFAAIREAYSIPREDKLKLRDFPTLAHVIQFVCDRRPDLAAAVGAETAAAPPAALPPAPATDAVRERVLALFAAKTGYPPDMLDPELDLEADLGIDTVKQAELFAGIREAYNIPRDDKLKLRDFPTLAHVIQFVRDRRPDLAVPAVVETPQPAARPTVAPLEPDAGDAAKARVLALFAEKTGYPPDMLEPDLDLEADLGIDTVKQAEMFAAIREAYNIPRDDKLKLRDFPTLAHVIQFVHDRRADRDAAMPTPQPEAQQIVPLPGPAGSMDAANRIPRRIPIPTLRPPLNLCKSTGVTLEVGSRVLVMPDQGGVSKTLLKRLKKLGVDTLALDPSADAGALTESIKSWLTRGPVHGVYWLPALDPERVISEMDLAAWRAALHVRVKLLYATMRAVYEHVAQPGTFLISATRLGGQHGYDEAGAYAPLGGPVVGFTKTYKRERDKALVKAVDFGPTHKAAEVADALVEETVRDPGVIEVGHKSGKRWSVGLQEQPVVDSEDGLALSRDSVFVVTGAAGSIVSAIIADLAAASGGTFYLLDKVPQPDPANPDIQRFVTDRENLKRDLFERIRARGERATPALVERELAALERAHAALSAIHAVRAAGGTARYFSVDLTDAAAVANVIEDVRDNSGHIDALIHAAGLEISRFLPDKEAREFDLVFDVKSDGWFNLLHAIGSMPLGATVAFSSIAGRFGNAGQTDYSAANDLLCKYSSSFRTTRPGTRGIAIDWTAWGGIGMATRGSIPKMMEAAGIDMLPADAGIPVVRRELVAGTRGEVVIAERLGILLNEWDDTGGLDTAALLNGTSAQRGPMLGKVVGMRLHGELTVETTLDPAAQPFLHDHRIDGTPVLPGVMGLEAFAELATLLLPDWHVAAIEDVEFLAPFKFYRNEARVVTLSAICRPDGDSIVADCRLTGSRSLPNQPEPQVTTHFTGRVRLVSGSPEGIHASVPHPPNGAGVTAPDIYRIYFHGPAYQVLEHVWRDGATTVGLMAEALPDNHTPPQLATLMTPRLIELCFQTAGIWEIGTTGHMGLPLHIDRVSALRIPDASSGRLHAVVNPNTEAGSFDARVLDANGNVCVDLHGYRTVELPTGIDAAARKPLQEAMG